MLGAFAGGESLEILVMLKDLSEQGFKKLERNIKGAEATANRSNFAGFSKNAKTLEKDAARAAGKGGIGGLLSGFLGLPGPIALAGGAIIGFSALTAAVIPVYEKAEQQQKALTAAFKLHGQSLEKIRPQIQQAIRDGEQYAFNSTETQGAILKLAIAGHKWADIQKSLPAIMDLARAKNIDLTEAARAYELALMGNNRALKELGIALPPVSKTLINLKDAKLNAKIAAQELGLATAHLKRLQSEHAVTTTKLTSTVNAHAVITDHVTKKTKGHTASAAELMRAQIAVERATQRNTKAQGDLSEAQNKGKASGDRLKTVYDAVEGAAGNQRGSVTGLQIAQTKLNDAWSRFATEIGPGLADMLSKVVDNMAGLVDQLTAFIDKLPQLPDWMTNPIDFNFAPTGPKGGTAYHGARGGNQNARPGNGRGGNKPQADGGWIGLHGPEMFLGGEKGPEYVTRNNHLPGGGGSGVHLHIHSVWPPTPQQIHQMSEALDHHEYYRGAGVAASGNRT